MTVVIDENWGISIERIRYFFSQQPDILQTLDGFLYKDCHIILTEMHGQVMGKWDFTRTRVQMEGNDEDVKVIHHRFYLRFLSAGG